MSHNHQKRVPSLIRKNLKRGKASGIGPKFRKQKVKSEGSDPNDKKRKKKRLKDVHEQKTP